MSGRARSARGLFERTVDGMRQAMERATSAEAGASAAGWMQRLDPRVKLAAVLALVAAIALSHRLDVIAALLAAGIVMAVTSRVPLSALASGVSLAAAAFAVALAAPALVLTPGRAVGVVPVAGWVVTAQGLMSACYLVLRAAAASTFGFLLVFTTPWAHVLKALRAFHVPLLFVAVLAMTYRYILLLLDSAHDMFVARRSRTVGRLTAATRRRLVAQSAGALLVKSLNMGNDVFLAMQARGYRGEVRVLDDFTMARTDWFALAAATTLAAVAVWVGR